MRRHSLTLHSPLGLACSVLLGCTKAASAPAPRTPAPPAATSPMAPLLQGAYSEAQPPEDTVLHELYLVFADQQLRVGHRMLGDAADPHLPTAAKLCDVYFDTSIEWTRTGFLVANGISAESQVGSLSVFLKDDDATSGSFSFDGSRCEVQLAPGAYTLEPTSERGEDGRPLAFVLTPPAGAPQRFIAAEVPSFQDLGQALWDSLQSAAE